MTAVTIKLHIFKEKFRKVEQLCDASVATETSSYVRKDPNKVVV